MLDPLYTNECIPSQSIGSIILNTKATQANEWYAHKQLCAYYCILIITNYIPQTHVSVGCSCVMDQLYILDHLKIS